MKRFIRYLYEYQQGQRTRNIGFVKVEQGEESTTVHIHGKGLRLTGEKTLRLYVFYRDGDTCIGIWQGDIEHVNPAVNYCLTFTPEDTGRPENYPVIEGIIMENDGRRRFAAVWDDMPADVEHMKMWEPPESAATEEPAEETECEEAAEPAEALEPEEAAEQPEPVEPQTQEPQEEPGAESGPRYTKIGRPDIAKLPRCQWRLANNSFLMHGCYNYHHLLLVEEDTGNWLGVPGVYHERERRAAEAFGFPRFLRVDQEALDLGPDEKNEVEDFGYWCRKI